MRKLISAKLFGVFALACVFVFLSSPVKAGPITLITDDFTKMKFTDFDHIIKGTGNTGAGLQAGDTLEGVFFVTDIGSTTNSTLLNAQLAGRQLTGYFHISVTTSTTLDHFGMTLNAGDEVSFYTTTPNTFKDSGGVSIAADITSAKAGTLWVQSAAGDMPLGDISTNPVTGTTTANAALNFSTNNSGYPIQKKKYFVTSSILSDASFLAQISALDPSSAADKNAIKAGWQFRSEDPVTVFALPEPSSIALLAVGGLGFAGVLLRRRLKPVV